MIKYKRRQSKFVNQNFVWFFALTPILFALHNTEEVVKDLPGFNKSSALLSVTAGLYRKDVFLVAVSLLTAIVTAVCVYGLIKRNRFALSLMTVVIAAMTTNALMHIVVSATTLGYGPGLTTAVCLMLPLGITFYKFLIKNGEMTTKRIVLLSIIGALTMAPAAFTALVIAKYLLLLA